LSLKGNLNILHRYFSIKADNKKKKTQKQTIYNQRATKRW